MQVILRLSSSVGDKTEQSNKNVAALCLDSPELLDEIAESFINKNEKLVADCIEVFTLVAETNPELILKYVEKIIPLLKNKNTRIRWEAMHTIALITKFIPEIINSIFFDIYTMILYDKSVIVRDYGIKTLAEFAGTNKETANKSFPVFIELLDIWGERHAAGIIDGLINLYSKLPEVKNELLKVVEDFENSERGTIRKATKRLKKILLNTIQNK